MCQGQDLDLKLRDLAGNGGKPGDQECLGKAKMRRYKERTAVVNLQVNLCTK